MTDHIPIDDLSATIDDALPPARRDLVDAHLAVCADCRAEHASLAWVAGYALALPPAELPEGLSFGVPVVTATPERPRLKILLARRSWLAVAGLAAAAAVLVAAIGLTRLWSAAPQQASGPPADAGGTPAGAAPGAGTVVGSGAVKGVADAGDPSGPDAGPDAAQIPLPPAQAAIPSDQATATAIAARGPLDIDTAARVAGGLVKQGDSAEAQTRPLATALTADRSQRVLGEPRPGAGPRPTATADPPVGRPGAAGPRSAAGTTGAPGTTGTTGAPGLAAASTAAPIDRGGYAPPDAPIPGLSNARSGSLAAARATVSTTISTTVSVTPPPMLAAAATDTTVNPAAPTAGTPGPVGGMEPPAPGMLTAWAATNTIDRASSAATGTARAPAASVTPTTTAETGAPGEPAPSAPVDGSGSGTEAAPPRSLLVPLSALSIGLLALGVLFLRQARARGRRRAWRQG